MGSQGMAQMQVVDTYRRQRWLQGLDGYGLMLGQQAADDLGGYYGDTAINYKIKPKGIREELQAETDEWLEDVDYV